MMIPRTRPMARGKQPRNKMPIRKANRERRAREFARCYHSEERVLFVKSLECATPAWCGPCAGPMDNAHTRNEGHGRKGHYTTIIPLCRKHHTAYDEHRAPFDDPRYREAKMAITAPKTERLWRSFQEQRDTQEEIA